MVDAPVTSAGLSSPARGDLLLGVDGGGRTTQAMIASVSGEILGRGMGPPSNHYRVGPDKAFAAITMAIEGAFGHLTGPRSERVAWPRTGIVSACFGLAGVDTPLDESLFVSWVRDQGATFKLSVVNDSELIFTGGTPEGWGVALISGTGSVCIGRNAAGNYARIGGWGHILGDEGSGYDIATGGLKLATQAADGRGGSPKLLEAALEYWKLTSPKDLLSFVYRAEMTADDVAGFAIRVLDLAGRNDPPAREVVDRAAKSLAVHFETVARKLQLTQPPLALGGAVMRSVMKNAILGHIGPHVGPVTVVSDPVQGAIAMARRLHQTAGDNR